ncbi:MerC domain-containing protein [Novosphingobium sp.]|jgi:hypothetical protein|uniref:MerC domain-containing protein n=1 Tax=Novosphingobium sp. TaxID=1874826 RepID=UPI002FDDAB84
MTQPFPALRSRLDRFGVLLSGLCMIHCLAGLFLVGVLGLGGGVLLNPEIHHIGLVLAIVIGAATIGMGALRHGHRLPLILGIAGLALMTAAVLVGHGAAESVLTICGVLLVATAHVTNMRRNSC